KSLRRPKRLITLTPGTAPPDRKPALRATKMNYRVGWTSVLRWSAGERRGSADLRPSRPYPITRRFDQNRTLIRSITSSARPAVTACGFATISWPKMGLLTRQLRRLFEPRGGDHRSDRLVGIRGLRRR